MAPASANGQLASTLADVSAIDDPVLMLVANNDTFQDDHSWLAQMAYDSLVAAGKTVTIIIYPDHDSNGDLIIDSSDDGHELFFSVRDPYWTDVIAFLDANSCATTGMDNSDLRIERPNISPNPTTGMVRIDLKSTEIEEVEVFNCIGQRIHHELLTNNETYWEIDLSGYSPGIYYSRTRTDQGVHTQGMIRE